MLKTVLFTDIAESTERAVRMGDRRWHDLLAAHDAAVRQELERYQGQRSRAPATGFLRASTARRGPIRCATAIGAKTHSIGLDVRSGLHSGECVARGDDFAGVAVHIGARVAGLAEPGEVLVTGTVRDLVTGSDIEFIDRGRHTLKGVPGDWQLLAVAS